MKTLMKTGLTAAALASATLAAPAYASDPGDRSDNATEVAMEVVYYSDLDLSTERDQRELRSRLRDAARYVCGMDVRITGSRFASPRAQQCYFERLEWIDREVEERVERQARRG